MSPPNKLTTDQLSRLIYDIRGQRVMLDSDLAAIYGVETKSVKSRGEAQRGSLPERFHVSNLVPGMAELEVPNRHLKFGPGITSSKVPIWHLKDRSRRAAQTALRVH